MPESSGPSAERPERPVRALRRRVAALEAELASLRRALMKAGIDVPAVSAPGETATADGIDGAAPSSNAETPEAPPVIRPFPGRATATGPSDVPLPAHLMAMRDHGRERPTSLQPPAQVVLPPIVEPTRAAASDPSHGLPSTVAAPAARAAVPPQEVDRRGIERFVGTKLLAWAGALVVIGAMALFLKYAYERGWLTRLPPSMRLVGAYVFACALIVAGEVAFRRIGRLAAAGFLAAGVGTLYLATLAGHWPLGVMGATPALLLATGAAVLGAALTVRSHLLSVGVVSLIGGFLAPILLGVLPTEGLLVPVHLTVLLAIGLGLAGFASPTFGPLRPMSVTLQLVVATLWFVFVGHETPVLSISMCAVWWSMVCGDAIVSALRGRSVGPCVGGMVVSSLAVASVGAIGLTRGSPWSEAYSYIPLALSLASTVLAFQFGGGIAALRPVSARERAELDTDDERALASSARTLGIALWGLGGLLLIAGLGIFLRHGALALAWVATGVAALEIGRRLRAMTLASYGAAALWLGAAAAALSSILRTFAPRMRPPLGFGWQLDIPPGFTAGLFAVAALFFVAWRWSVPAPPRLVGEPEDDAPDISGRFGLFAAATGTLATALWMIGCLFRAGPCLALTLMTVPGLLLAVAMRHDLRRWPRVLAATSLAIVVATWLLLRSPAFHGASGVVGLIVGPLVAVGGFWLLSARTPERRAQERLLVASIAALAVIALAEIYLDALLPNASGRLRSDVAACALAGLGVAAIVAGRMGPWRLVIAVGALLTLLGSGIWLLFGTTVPRLDGPFAEPVLLSATVGTGVAMIIAVVVAHRARGELDVVSHPAFNGLVPALISLLVLLPVWLVSFVIDAALDPRRGLVADSTPKQAALSVAWGLAALVMIGVGFARRRAGLRYAGLGLLAVVAVKVLLVDMQGATTIWRVLGLLAAGLLMVATSVLYVRLGKFFDERHTDDAPPAQPRSAE